MKSRERCRYLILGGNTLRHDRLPDRFECQPGQRLSLALGPRGLRQGHLRSGNARGLEAGVQLAPHRVIPAASLEQLAVGAYEEVEPVVGRMTAPPIEISVLDEENTPRPDTGPHAAKQSDGLTQVLKQEPAVHDLDCMHRGAVDHSRASLKPEIPLVGNYGIPLRDELELELEKQL